MSDALTAWQAVAEVMRDVSAVAKASTATVKTKGDGADFRYKFRGIDAVVNAVGPAMRKHGLVLVPHVAAVDIVPMPGRNGWTETRLTVEYDVVGPDGSTLPRPVRSFGVGADNGDKGPGKALSYAFRYALLQLFMIPTDDPEIDNEATIVPDPEPTVSEAQARQIVAVFDGLDEDRRAAAKRAWAARFGDPFALPAARFDEAYGAAMDAVEAHEEGGG